MSWNKKTEAWLEEFAKEGRGSLIGYLAACRERIALYTVPWAVDPGWEEKASAKSRD